MAIKTRETVAPATIRQPRREPVRRPPTQSMLSLAAYRLADELGGRDLPQADRDAAAADIYEFASKSVATAWSLVDAADIAVRAYSGRRKLSGAHGDVVGSFRKSLDEAKAADLKSKAELIEELKKKDTSDERKAEIEKELKELLLRGIPQGREYKLGSKASEFLLGAMLREFQPVKGSPLADEDFPKFLGENLRFLDWLGRELLFTEEQNAAYSQAKEQDKAARAQDAAEPAPEADAEEESDNDSAEADAEETEAPAAESASA